MRNRKTKVVLSFLWFDVNFIICRDDTLSVNTKIDSKERRCSIFFLLSFIQCWSECSECLEWFSWFVLLSSLGVNCCKIASCTQLYISHDTAPNLYKSPPGQINCVVVWWNSFDCYLSSSKPENAPLMKMFGLNLVSSTARSTLLDLSTSLRLSMLGLESMR